MQAVLEIKSNKSIEETAEALQQAVVNHQFGVMATHNLRATMAKKGVEFDRDCLVYEVCNPHQAKHVLEENMAISTALPCRISIYHDGDKTVLATIRPTTLLGMFGVEGVAAVAQEVEETMMAIMNEAAAG